MGTLLYITMHTRLDIAATTSMLAQLVDSPSKKYHTSAVGVVKYLKSANGHGLVLKRRSKTSSTAQVDENWAHEAGSGNRSRRGAVIDCGSAVVNYGSKLQKGVTLSSTEAE